MSASEPVGASALVLSVDEAAELLGVSANTVHSLRLRDRFPLPAIQPLGPRGRVLIPRAQLEEWLVAEAADPGRAFGPDPAVVTALRGGRS